MLKFKNMMTNKLMQDDKKLLINKTSPRSSPRVIRANKKLKMQREKKSDEIPLVFYDSESPLSHSPKAVRFAFEVKVHHKKYSSF